MTILTPNGTAFVTDVLIGIGNSTASMRGTLAFAVAFFGPLASNRAILNQSFSVLQAEEDAVASLQLDAETENMRTAFYRRTYDAENPLTQAYQPGRNLTTFGLPTPYAAHCDSEFVECVPGPCSVWEYDYQFLGLQESQFGKIDNHVMQPSGVYSGPGAAAFATENADDTFFPMVGMPRCGPLFNYQYVDVLNADGTEYTPNYKDENKPNPISSFDKQHVVVPPLSAITHDTFKFLPAAGGQVDVYPIHGVAMIPVPHGVNYNPRWYYEGYTECFPAPHYESGGAAAGCDLETLLVNWLYDVRPAELQCHAMTEPPPYAPLGPNNGSNVTENRRASKVWTNLVDEFDVQRPKINETDAAERGHMYTGNPRLVQATTPDGLKRPLLVGYSRGQEENTDQRYEVIRTYDAFEQKSTLSRQNGPSIAKNQHYPNGRGPNHRITPHELPYEYRPNTCDFTQCRWLPRAKRGATRYGRKKKSDRVKDKRKEDRIVKPWDAMYMCLASELAQANDHLDSWAGVTLGTSIGYSQELAEANRLRCYGAQHLRYVTIYIENVDMVLVYGSGAVEAPNVTLTNGEILSNRTYQCRYEGCDVNVTSPEQNNRGPYCLNETALLPQYEIERCERLSNSSTCPLCSNANMASGMLPYESSEWVCCVSRDTHGLIPGNHAVFDDKDEPCNYNTDTHRGDAMYDDQGFTTFNLGYQVNSSLQPLGSRLHCEAFHARTKNMALLMPNSGSDTTGKGEMNGKCNVGQLIRNPGANADWFGVAACYEVLGVYAHHGAVVTGARQIVVDNEKELELYNSEARRHGKKNENHPLSMSRYAVYQSDADDRLKDKEKQETPGMPGMSCVDDDDAFLYELSQSYRLHKTPGGKNIFVNERKFSFDYNLIPTENNRGYLLTDSDRLDEAAQFHDAECERIGDPANKQKTAENSRCGPYIMAAPETPKPRTSRYRTLDSYYAETRAAYPNPEAMRQAAFPNSNRITDGFACDCKARTIVWRHLDVPPEPLKTLATESEAAGSPASGRVFEKLQKKEYKSSIPAVRSLAWTVPQTATTPDVGLFLPSSQPTFYMVERDFLKNATRVTDASALRYDSPQTEDLETKYTGVDAPRREQLRNMTLNGTYIKGPKWRQHSIGMVRNVVTFNRGSCLRWPYGQVPRMMFGDAEQRKTYYPENPVTGDSYDFDLNATMGYCEPISKNVTKFQACYQDRLAPAERNQFCKEHPVTARNVLYAAQLDPRSRTIETMCSTEHRTCLVVPGPEDRGSLGSVLKQHHVKHRSRPSDGENYTFLVTPFNSTVLELFLGPDRVLAPVAGGRDFTRFSHFDALADSDNNVTGVKANATAFAPFDANTHSVSDIQDAATFVLGQFLNITGPASGCPSGEYRIPARTDSPKATECVAYSAIVTGSDETGAETRFSGTVVKSAVPGLPIQFGASDSHRCERIIVNSPSTRLESGIVADQSKCPTDAAAVVAVRSENAADTFVQNVTVISSRAAVGVVVTPVPPGTSDISRAVFGPVVFSNAYSVPNSIRVDAAFAAAVGANVSAKGLNVVLMPRLGAGNLTFLPLGQPNSTKDLSSTLAEAGTGVLRQLFPIIPTAGHSTIAIFGALVVAVVALAVVAVYEMQDVTKRAAHRQHPTGGSMNIAPAAPHPEGASVMMPPGYTKQQMQPAITTPLLVQRTVPGALSNKLTRFY